MGWLQWSFISATLLQLLYYGMVLSRAWRQPKQFRQPANTETLQGVSIIVCARNEAKNLKEHLPVWLNQSVFSKHSRGSNPSSSELIIVDDGSTDETAAIIRDMQSAHPYLRLIQPPQPTRAGKKEALTAGIRAANNDLLLLTDADCRPASNDWAALMASGLNGESELVLGYSPYLTDNNWLGRWQAFETDYTALQYLGFAQIGLAYMGVGRNMAYQRQFFERVNGFADHLHLPGGDDDLLVGQAARAGSTEVQIQKEAWTYSKPSNSWGEYWQRKHRHLSVGRHYSRLMRALLGLLALSHGLHYLLGLVLVLAGSWRVFVLFYLLRIVVVSIVYCLSPRICNERNTTLFYLPLLDAGLCFYYLFNLWTTLFSQSSKQWEKRS